MSLMAIGMAVTAGIIIGSRIISFIADELSESERREQEAMEKDYQKYADDLDEYYEYLNQQTKHQKDNIRQKFDADRKKAETDTVKKIRNSINNIYRKHSNAVSKRIVEKQKLLTELKASIESINQALKNQHSFLRINSLNQLQWELMEGKWKLCAYISYLKRYKRILDKNYERIYANPLAYTNSEVRNAFPKLAFLLPEKYFYYGKIIFLKKSELKSQDSICVTDNIFLEYRFNDFEYIKDYADSAELPLMCEMEEASITPLSVQKGIFRHTILNSPRIGLSAVVTGYTPQNEILLEFSPEISLYLKKSKLENIARIPPIGAQLHVYPLRKHYNMWDYIKIFVSEKSSDCFNQYRFNDIPIVFSKNRWKEFHAYLQKNNLADRCGDWKIAPFSPENTSDASCVKFQLDTDLVFWGRIAKTQNGRPYFFYEALLDDSYKLTPEDIFLGINCVLNVILEDEITKLPEETYSNTEALICTTASEFKIQEQILASQAGMEYFNKWAEVNNKLILHLHKSTRYYIDLKIAQWQRDNQHQDKLTVIPENVEKLTHWIEKLQKENNLYFLDFFIDVPSYGYAYVRFKPDCSSFELNGDIKSLTSFLEKLHKTPLRIYKKEIPYPEIQQAAAFQFFRTGRIANSELHPAALNSKNIVSHKNKIPEMTFFNKTIETNPSQIRAVIGALQEKNIFLILGPPGTGKTTVIREIIYQFLKQNPLSRILVVSQANVAVDNVLKGLLPFCRHMIRCGNEDKIDPDISEFSFPTQYKNYINTISKKLKEEPGNDLLRNWCQIIDINKNSYNSHVGNLLIRATPVIGATCIGLAKKHIGLDKINFDLVIVDEAGKALPGEILIPYIRAKKIILIGDHKQLPPTIHPALLSQKEIQIEDREIYEDTLFQTSFFEKMYENAPDTNKCMLETQFRMPAVIGDMIGSLFYQGKLQNGLPTYQKQSLFENNHLIFINIDAPYFIERSTPGQSVSNPGECVLLMATLKKIRESVSAKERIVVMTPYLGQKSLIQSYAQKYNIDLKENNIVINTVDALQGDEAEIIIFCTTRTKQPTKYFSDFRRLNVAFSRAKNNLIIIGSLSYFRKYKSDRSSLPAIAQYVTENANIYSYKDFIKGEFYE